MWLPALIMRSLNYCLLLRLITGSLAVNFCEILVCDSFTIISKYIFRAVYLRKFGQLGTGVHTHTRTSNLACSHIPPFRNHETKCHAYLDKYIRARMREYFNPVTRLYILTVGKFLIDLGSWVWSFLAAICEPGLTAPCIIIFFKSFYSVRENA